MDYDLLSKITLKNVELSDIEDILSLCDKELGNGYLDYSLVKEAMKSRKKDICVALYQDKIIGFCYTYIISPDSIDTRHGLQPLVDKLKDIKSVGIIKTVAVDNNYQRRGVGTILIDHALQFTKNQNAKAAFSVAWNKHGIINIGSVLEKFNFKNMFSIERFWEVASIEKDFDCPSCGAPPCQCTATIFVLNNLNTIAPPV